LIPCQRDCDLTRKFPEHKGGRSHESINMNSQDLPQPSAGTFSTLPEEGKNHSTELAIASVPYARASTVAQ
ncbi:MAG: hypothetical protein ACE5K8_08755, partial [Candidatus Zixiibacteriota bacterium]